MSRIAKFVTWREWRGTGWSKTTYSGFILTIEDKIVMVTKLSHGLRALLSKDGVEYLFTSDSVDRVVSDEFVAAVQQALMADLEFQKQLSTFEKLCTF